MQAENIVAKGTKQFPIESDFLRSPIKHHRIEFHSMRKCATSQHKNKHHDTAINVVMQNNYPHNSTEIKIKLCDSAIFIHEFVPISH